MQSTLVKLSIQTVRPVGHINAANAHDFQSELLTAVSSEQNSVVLVDLEKVDSLDSAGLMALVSALRLAQSLEKQFTLCSVSPAIRIIFELTQLDRVFEISENPIGCEAA